MSTATRLRDELTFHDAQALQRRVTFDRCPDRLLFDDESYLTHETWIRPALERLGSLDGSTALDYGCGHGMAAVVMARRGARVTAFDLSGGYIQEAARRAEANGVQVDFVQADGARLPFADASFDRIWGNAVLHHLDTLTAARELRRVLRPGGIVVFCEPWGGNPLLRWARARLPYQAKEHTADEKPLQKGDLEILKGVFAQIDVQGFQLLGMVRRVCGPGRLTVALDRCDEWLLRAVPPLWRLSRYVVLTMR